jgi:hypothetical protein
MSPGNGLVGLLLGNRRSFAVIPVISGRRIGSNKFADPLALLAPRFATVGDSECVARV